MNLKITSRLAIILTINILITLSIGVAGYFSILSGNQSIDNLQKNDVKCLFIGHELKIIALQHRRFEKDMFLNIGNRKKQKKYLSRFRKHSSLLNTKLDTLSQLLIRSKHNDAQTLINQATEEYKKYHDNFIEIAIWVCNTDTITPQTANKKMIPFKEHIYAFENAINELLLKTKNHSTLTINSAKQKGANDLLLMVFIIIIGIVISLFLAISLSIRIKNGLHRIIKNFEQISKGEGDLTQRLEIIKNDEIGQLSNLFNKFINKLHTISSVIYNAVSELRIVAKQLIQSIKTITSDLKSLMQKTEQASSSVKQIKNDVASISDSVSYFKEYTQNFLLLFDQIQGSIRQISEHSGKEVEKSNYAFQISSQTKSRIKELNQSVGLINVISDEIKELSEETSILALNASVEAVKAGQAGIGFSVIAQEVKNLARQSGLAAKKIGVQNKEINIHTSAVLEALEKINGVVNEQKSLSVKINTELNNQINSLNSLSEKIEDVNQKAGLIAQNAESAKHEFNFVSQIIDDANNFSHVLNTVTINISQHIDNLSQLSHALNEHVGKFKI